MSEFHELFGVGGSAIKSLQGGYVSTTTYSGGSGEDTRYVDVTISAVDVTKAIVSFQGCWNTTVGTATGRASGFDATWRLTSPTNLRISTNQSSTSTNALVGRWTVKEYR